MDDLTKLLEDENNEKGEKKENHWESSLLSYRCTYVLSTGHFLLSSIYGTPLESYLTFRLILIDSSLPHRSDGKPLSI